MHDWTLLSIAYEWRASSAEISLRNAEGKTVSALASKVVSLKIPHREEWGPSVSVNKVSSIQTDANTLVSIEMQSGDVIEIEARSFSWPANVAMQD